MALAIDQDLHNAAINLDEAATSIVALVNGLLPGTPTFDTAQDLRDQIIPAADVPSVALTLGALSNGDGGAGLWHWDASSELSDNGGCFLPRRGGVGGGRWVRQYSYAEVTPKAFGAQPGSDVLPILKTYRDWCLENGQPILFDERYTVCDEFYISADDYTYIAFNDGGLISTNKDNPIFRLSGRRVYGQGIMNLSYADDVTITSSDTRAIGFAPNNLARSLFDGFRIQHTAKAIAVHPDAPVYGSETLSYAFSLTCNYIAINDFVINGIEWRTHGGGGNTGSIFNNTCINNYVDEAAQESSGPVIVYSSTSECVFNQLNIEWCVNNVFISVDSDSQVLVINGLHMEGNEIKPSVGNLLIQPLGAASVVINGWVISNNRFDNAQYFALVGLSIGSIIDVTGVSYKNTNTYTGTTNVYKARLVDDEIPDQITELRICGQIGDQSGFTTFAGNVLDNDWPYPVIDEDLPNPYIVLVGDEQTLWSDWKYRNTIIIYNTPLTAARDLFLVQSVVPIDTKIRLVRGPSCTGSNLYLNSTPTGTVINLPNPGDWVEVVRKAETWVMVGFGLTTP